MMVTLPGVIGDNDQEGRPRVEFDHELAWTAQRLVIEYEGRLPITPVIRVLSEVGMPVPVPVPSASRTPHVTGPDSAPPR